ncbi:hypothetical protein ASPWEDRAFT_41839 [Aspergillus wentii DTO 134E9]|uniref:Uncharacterized protein n=1 Tax=Aspergillus wentii DTO 134E9 TaxID=1073089 RepID=A0A1L9RGH2_ASPWE|nr:uncharacterized protein ASPWEDRAFT_41839 [Aspergillus wentii DTO 134E9]OJJ33953.1 hypothetical protein ASPWEDRAFT_41839 [Aspergillus wentii DTO 134E9]
MLKVCGFLAIYKPPSAKRPILISVISLVRVICQVDIQPAKVQWVDLVLSFPHACIMMNKLLGQKKERHHLALLAPVMLRNWCERDPPRGFPNGK